MLKLNRKKLNQSIKTMNKMEMMMTMKMMIWRIKENYELRNNQPNLSLLISYKMVSKTRMETRVHLETLMNPVRF